MQSRSVAGSLERTADEPLLVRDRAGRVRLAWMELRRLILPALLVAAAVSLANALATREGVGPFEYVVTIAIIGGLLVIAFRLGRRAVRRA